MRTVLGYVNGRAIWSENVPASPGLLAVPRGALVVGESGRAEDPIHKREQRARWAAAYRERKLGERPLRTGCNLDGRCLHRACIEKRRVAAVQMRETGLGLAEIGEALKRSRQTVSELIVGKRRPERCGNGCERPIGHEGECRASWFDRPLCGEWMPVAKQQCVRRMGHKNEHRSAEGLEYKRLYVADRRAA